MQTGTASSGKTPTAVPTLSEIPGALQRIEKSLSGLEEVIEALENRLLLVLTPLEQPSASAKTLGPDTMTSLGATLVKFSEIIEAQADRLRSMGDRVGL